MSTFQPEVLIQFNAERYFPDNSVMQDALKRESLRELDALWRIIDHALQSGPYFLGESYSICDMLFLMQAIWVENQPADLNNFPSAKRMMLDTLERPAVQRIFDIHKIEHLAEI